MVRVKLKGDSVGNCFYDNYFLIIIFSKIFKEYDEFEIVRGNYIVFFLFVIYINK